MYNLIILFKLCCSLLRTQFFLCFNLLNLNMFNDIKKLEKLKF
jgi:hypothetical protein